MSGNISASLEDYLEAIFNLCNEGQAARPKDIARRLQVRASSVTGALKALAERGLVNYTPYGAVSLTANGTDRALEVTRRHAVLREFFEGILGIDHTSSDKAACKLEHDIGPEILARLVQFVQFFKDSASAGSCLESFRAFCCEHSPDACEQALTEHLHDDEPADPSLDAGAVAPPTTLKHVPPGGICTVIKVGGRGAVRRRMMDLGLTPGAAVRVCRIAPLGDPIEIAVKGCHLSLRKHEADTVAVRT